MTEATAREPIQAVFIDSDGTIGGIGHFIHPNDFQTFVRRLALEVDDR